MASVKWKPETQEAGSLVSQLIWVWWWGGIFPFCLPWDIPPYPLQRQAGLGVSSQRCPGARGKQESCVHSLLYLLPQANAPLIPPVAFKCRFPLLHPTPPWWHLLLSFSCQGKKTTTGGKLSFFLLFYSIIATSFSPLQGDWATVPELTAVTTSPFRTLCCASTLKGLLDLKKPVLSLLRNV